MKYIIYRNSSNDYESFVERFSLRERKKDPHLTKEKLTERAQEMWKKEQLKKNPKKLAAFLSLKPGEKEFVRYHDVKLYLVQILFLCAI